MKKRVSLLVAFSFLALSVLTSLALKSRAAGTPETPQQITAQIIAREKAGYEAWQRKDKAFYADFMADDATYFSPMNPYLQIDPKTNFLPKFEQYAEQYKYLDYQIFNPRVQIYGDTAVLTYNGSFTLSMGGQAIQYTGKMTSVYVKQGNTWRVVHGHESMNPGTK
jgi:ketosteroid isomerase-like protein